MPTRWPWTSSQDSRARLERCCALVLCVLIVAGCATTPEPEADPVPTGLTERLGYLRTKTAEQPQNADLHYQYGNALYDFGNYGEAMLAYQRTVELAPQRADAWANLGLTLRRLGEIKAAIGAYETALDFSPEDADLWREVLRLAETTQDVARMQRCLAQLSMLQPEDTAVLAASAALSLQSGAYADAAAAYEKLIARDPGIANDHFNLGLCRYELDDPAAAEAAWTRAIAIDPAHPAANRSLAALYWETARYDAAWAAVAQCNAQGIPLDPAFLRTLQQDSGRMTP